MTPNQITGLHAFARYMVDAALDGGDVDGGTIQEIAHQYGLLTKREMKGPCLEPEEGYCACAFESGFPVECYQPTDVLIAKSAPTEPDAELVELLREARELIEHGVFEDGICCCGASVDSHGFGDGHSPVDALAYHAGQVCERIDAKLASRVPKELV